MDKQGYIQSWNKGAEKNKGWKADEIINKHFSSFYQQKDIKDRKPERELELAARDGRVEDEDWRVRKDGSMFWANVVITALRDESGELVGYAKVTRNLTDRKQAEDRLRDANTILRVQKEELKCLNASKDEFISLASHQLRTPATAIKQLLGLILEGFAGDVPEHLLPLVQKTYESNERQIGIINSLLKVAQIDAGKVILRKKPTNINNLVQDIVSEQAEVITERKQRIVLELALRPPLVSADGQYLRMALENLIDNASKYSPDHKAIHIKTASTTKGFVIAIQDEGIGIGEESLGKLFDKFVRIPSDHSQKVVGSGLGLYWVKKVIELHAGRIRVKSELGKGTTFYISLPVIKVRG